MSKIFKTKNSQSLVGLQQKILGEIYALTLNFTNKRSAINAILRMQLYYQV